MSAYFAGTGSSFFAYCTSACIFSSRPIARNRRSTRSIASGTLVADADPATALTCSSAKSLLPRSTVVAAPAVATVADAAPRNELGREHGLDHARDVVGRALGSAGTVARDVHELRCRQRI